MGCTRGPPGPSTSASRRTAPRRPGRSSSLRRSRGMSRAGSAPRSRTARRRLRCSSGTCVGSCSCDRGVRREREVVAVERRPRLQVAARRIALAVGFGTVLSPRANWMITGSVDVRRVRGRVAACCAHSLLSITVWIADAPGTVSMTIGSFRSGMFSLKFVQRRVRAPRCRATACASSSAMPDQRRGRSATGARSR